MGQGGHGCQGSHGRRLGGLEGQGSLTGGVERGWSSVMLLLGCATLAQGFFSCFVYFQGFLEVYFPQTNSKKSQLLCANTDTPADKLQHRPPPGTTMAPLLST
jgi:hypothetical protein